MISFLKQLECTEDINFLFQRVVDLGEMVLNLEGEARRIELWAKLQQTQASQSNRDRPLE